MIHDLKQTPTHVSLSSECGRLNAVLLHKPGVEIELMTPENASQALYSDILNKKIVDAEYANFCGVFERYAEVYYVSDIIRHLLDDEATRELLVRESCRIDGCDFLTFELLQLSNDDLARVLIEGFEFKKGFYPETFSHERYVLKPLYNLFFTRDASSSLYDRVLINSMSFPVRRRETLIFKTIFEKYFATQTINAEQWHPSARTEGGDVQVAREDLLCIGEGIRTNGKGIEFLAETFAKERPKFHIIAQQLPKHPDSFIHLDMVFTFLSTHQCMMYEPMLRKSDIFAGKQTTLITIDNGNIRYEEMPNMLDALKAVGMEMEPIFCGGSDPWTQQREQWHSGANFFALDEGRVIGYDRNSHTIEALNKAGFEVLDAEAVCKGAADIYDYEKCVVTFKASELPRAGGGARCMTMPINRCQVTGR